MKLQDWQAWYDRIVSVFGYSLDEDQRAADLLSRLLEGRVVPLNRLREAIRGQPVLVLGAGPSLEDDLKGLLDAGVLGGFAIVSADGATTALLNVVKAVPRVVVTDLDGRIRDLLKADASGALMVVHGHGDNIPVLERIVPKLVNRIGSTQAEPRPNVYNFGGFTDGDRAVFLAAEMGARLIVLAGMDFGLEVGEYSKAKPRPKRVKRMKLGIGKQLLEWLASGTNVPLYNVTRRGEAIRGFKQIAPGEVQAIL